MPIMSIVAAAIAGGILTQSKSIVDFLCSMDCYIRYVVERDIDSIDNLKSVDTDVISCDDQVLSKIVSKIIGKNLGIFVFAAPVGSGKSTLIKMAMKEIKNSNRRFKVKLIENGDFVLRMRSLHDSLKIPADRCLSEFLPKDSIIIVDQVSMQTKFNRDLYAYLNGLASDSASSKKYKIIICVSDASLATQILQCDALKIRKLRLPDEMIWSEKRALQFMNKYDIFRNLTDVDRDLILKAASECNYSPGLLSFMREYKEFDKELKGKFKKAAVKIRKCWAKFSSSELKDRVTVIKEAAINEVVFTMTGKNLGIFVFAAPVGSGKSTLIKMAMKEIKNSNRRFKVKLIENGDFVLRMRSLHDSLKIPADRCLSEFLPKDSIIIVDQVSMQTKFNRDLYAYLNGLASDSASSKKYKIIICVSDASLATQILQCDALKIRKLRLPDEMIWSEKRALQFMNKYDIFRNLTDVDRDLILKAASECNYSPGLLSFMREYKEFDKELKEKLKKTAIKIRKSLEDFENLSVKIHL